MFFLINGTTLPAFFFTGSKLSPPINLLSPTRKVEKLPSHFSDEELEAQKAKMTHPERQPEPGSCLLEKAGLGGGCASGRSHQGVANRRATVTGHFRSTIPSSETAVRSLIRAVFPSLPSPPPVLELPPSAAI